MIRTNLYALLGAALIATVPITASAETVDFTTLPALTAVTTQFDGLTFSLEGGPDSSGPPTTNFAGVTNTVDGGEYPTASAIDIAFSTPADEVSFYFDNAGENGTSYYTAYDASDDVLSTGNIGGSSCASGCEVTVAGDDISELQVNNGRDGDNWWFAVGSLTYSSTPEPASFFLCVPALLGLATLRKRKKA
jgi:hypothetical protein